MGAESALKLNNYHVEKIEFILNKKFIYQEDNISITPTFGRIMKELEKDKFYIQLRSTVGDDKNKNIPFYLDVVISGVFEIECEDDNTKKNVVKNNGTSILFPYLRALISSVTSLSNFPQFILPVLNTAVLFDC